MRESDSSFRAQIVYSGIDGNTLHAVYREFVGDFARPAFSQNLQYNLQESSEIAFRSVVIEVVEATNSRLRYRVREDGGLPWVPRR